jgi:ABC-type uncharacterized transport system substrate-binding protein
MAADLVARRVTLIASVGGEPAVPAAKTIAVLLNSGNPNVELQLRDVRETAPHIGVEIIAFNANAEGEFEAIFATMALWDGPGGRLWSSWYLRWQHPQW